MTDGEVRIKALLNSVMNYEGSGSLNTFERFKRQLKDLETRHEMTGEQFTDTLAKIATILKV